MPTLTEEYRTTKKLSSSPPYTTIQRRGEREEGGRYKEKQKNKKKTKTNNKNKNKKEGGKVEGREEEER